MQRKTDKNKQNYFRTIRMFKDETGFYFKTREGKVIGPFEDELQASTSLEVYIRMIEAGLMQEAENFAQEAAVAKSAG